jgi:hypothetical protein
MRLSTRLNSSCLLISFLGLLWDLKFINIEHSLFTKPMTRYVIYFLTKFKWCLSFFIYAFISLKLWIKPTSYFFSSYRWIEDGCTVSSLRTFILWSTLTPFSRQSKTMSHAIHGMKATCAAHPEIPRIRDNSATLSRYYLTWLPEGSWKTRRYGLSMGKREST